MKPVNVYKTKKGNELFELNGKVYVIVERDTTEIGRNGNYCKKVIIELEQEDTKNKKKK